MPDEKESPEELYAREMLEALGTAQFRKKPVPKKPGEGQKTPDYDLWAQETVVAVAEIKSFEQTPRTSENGWKPARGGGVTRQDNAPARVAQMVHEAVKQLRAQVVPKVLVFVNDERQMDNGDLHEALLGYMDYGDETTGHRNTAFANHPAIKRIEGETELIDLFVWLDRYRKWQLPQKPEGPFFTFGSDAGYRLARRFFGAPETPKPTALDAAPEPTVG